MKRSRLKKHGRVFLRKRREYVEAVAEVRARADGKCERCRKWLGYFGGDIHHIRPRSLGGVHDVENLRLLCRSCHNGVEEKTVEDWAKWLDERPSPAVKMAQP